MNNDGSAARSAQREYFFDGTVLNCIAPEPEAQPVPAE
jgi:hypothetical protein